MQFLQAASNRENAMSMIQANGIQLYWESSGTGEPLLLISGFACDHSIWSMVANGLAPRYRLISFDNRGVGRSSSPDSPYSIKQMAEDAASLLDQIGVGSAHIAGHSMGGLIAQELAFACPNKVRSLLLLSTCAQGDERTRARMELFGELPGKVDPLTNIRIIMPWVYTNAFFSRPGAVNQLVKWFFECAYPATPTGIYHQSRAIIACQTIERLGEIRCPTLVLTGSEDVLITPSMSKELANGIANAEFVVLQNTGHGLLIESPDAVAAAMLEFLNRQSR
jgi:pimeloyl-ACP methyl ester carboxylesterase